MGPGSETESVDADRPPPSMDSTPGTTVRIAFLVGVVAFAFNLRPAIVSVSPLLEQIRIAIGASYAVVSLLTTIPPLMMGVFAFLAPWVARQVGRIQATLYATGLLFVGLAIRLAAANPVVLFGSTFFVGIGIAIGQAYLPALVEEYFSDRTAFATGLYSTSIIAGAGIAAGITAPVWDRLDSWPLALAVWAVPAGIGFVVWAGFTLIEFRAETDKPDTATDTPADGVDTRGLPWRDRTAWLTVLFFAGQAMLFYVVVTWLPPLYVNQGLSAEQSGFILLSVFATMPIVSLTMSNLVDRIASRRLPYVFVLGALAAGSLAIAVAPLANPFAWAVLLGIGLGGVFPLALVLPADHAATPDAAARLTSMTFGVGYTITATGPIITGFLRDTLGNFTVVFLGLAGGAIALIAVALKFTPDRIDTVD